MENLYGIMLFLSALFLISISNNIILKKLRKYNISNNLPFISILVPARNEENNIYNCVESLLEQDYPDFEVIVNNDSTDRTGEILETLSKKYKKLKIIQSKKLKPGWVGKQWSCHQLYENASGEYLLFVDADTVHHKDMLKYSISAMQKENAGLLTMFPYEETGTIGEKLIVPMMHWSMITIFPIYLMKKLKRSSLVIAVGQYMLFRRKAYESIGGHKSIKDKPVDDVAISRKMKSCGFSVSVVDGTELVKCRMYSSLKEAHDGFSRSLFGAMGYRVVPFLFMWTWILICFWQPIAAISFELFGVNTGDGIIYPAAACIVMSIFLFHLAFRRFGYPFYLVFFYPVIILISYSAAIRSMFNALFGRSKWKGRLVLRHEVALF